MSRSMTFALASAMMIAWTTPALAGSQVAQGKDFGVGIQLGYPGNGFSFNRFLSPKQSLQVDATFWNSGDWAGVGARVDLLQWQPKLDAWPWGEMLWYFGPGANVLMFSWKGEGLHQDDYLFLGVEFPVGIGLRFASAPIDLNLEAVPILGILGSDGLYIDFDAAAVLNGRYYF